MPMKAFTDRWLKSIKTDKLKEEYLDISFNEKGSFGVIVSKTGTKRFFHRYSINGKKRRDILGSYPSLSLAAAREKAIENVSHINKGSDPTAAKREYKTAETFCELVELFFERSNDRLSRGTLLNYNKMYERDLKPAWEGRKAADITKADVIQLLEHICYERKAPIKANRTQVLISRIFNFGISRDVVRYNPVHGLEKLAPERQGERVFSHDEIKLFWQATENQKPHIRAIFRLLLLTGQRPGEIKSIEWAHIDGTILTIPSANSKNRRKHQIHLTDSALKEIELMRQCCKDKKYVFALGENLQPINYLTKGFESISAKMEELLANQSTKPGSNTLSSNTLEDWTTRDLRRTAQTRMAELGVRPDVVDRVLNHNVSGVRKHYDHYSYYPEIKKALIRWELRLSEIISGKLERKVVDLASYSEAVLR